MTKYIYIPADGSDFDRSINETNARKVKSRKDEHYPYGITPQNNYIISHFEKITSIRSAIEDKERIANQKLYDLIREIKEYYLPVIDLKPGNTTHDYNILIHFGGLDSDKCMQFNKNMNHGCSCFGLRFKFFAVSRANSYPPECWKNGALVFPDERVESAVHSPDLNHLKRFYRLCQDILSEPDYTDRFNDREFWFLTLWDGLQPKTFEKAFSESEISLLLKDENKKMKEFFEALLFSSPSAPKDIDTPEIVICPAPATPSVSASATISAPASASASATISVPSSASASASASASVASPNPGLASGSTATPIISVFQSRTVSETPSIDAPAAYKIISQIMRIFNPPTPAYVPAYIPFKTPQPSKPTALCLIILSIFLVIIPTIIRFIIPGEAEYETEIETKTPDPPDQREGCADGKTSFASHKTMQVSPTSIFVESETRQHESETGQKNADSLCRVEKKVKKAAPFQYFHIFLLFSALALYGILSFIIYRRVLRINSRKQIIDSQDIYFSNLGRYIATLKPEDQDAVVKQFAQTSIRLYFNGDDGE